MSQQTRKFDRRGFAGQVADELRRRILIGEILEGAQLMQEQIAAEFGISKVPVREALFQLEAEGFVTQQYHRGAIVTGMAPDEVLQIFELRTQIEAWLLELAMPLATAADVARARKLAKELSDTQGAIESWDANWRFHEALYLPAGKPYVVEHLQKVHSQTGRYLHLQYDATLAKASIIRQHEELLKLYAAKDARAIDFLRDHIMDGARKLAARLQELKDARG